MIHRLSNKPVVLIVLDGWGIMPPHSGNAISQARTPIFDSLITKYPSTTLLASGEAVGLPREVVGNSETGHLNLGLGRIIYQSLPKINKAINNNSFYKNTALLRAIEHVKKNNSKLHLLGLISDGSIHSSKKHLRALLILAKKYKIKEVYIHAILDGRDTLYNEGVKFIKNIQNYLHKYGIGKIVTISGRFYAMDRDNHWERIAKAYVAIVNGKGRYGGDDPIKIIQDSYDKKVYDEEFLPTVLTKDNEAISKIEDNDSVIFFNYRADRARQLTKTLVLPGFEKFTGWKYLNNLFFVCFTQYEKDLPVEIAFPADEKNSNSLGEIISKAGLKQLRIAETEKYVHVTYFFNGNIEEPFNNENHVLIPSPRVDSYDVSPKMSAIEITKKVIKFIHQDIYDFILINFANADMIGHTGNLQAGIKAIETVDKCLGKIIKNVLNNNGIAIVTADHGNAEMMFDVQANIINKEHTNNPVPFVIVSKQFEGKTADFQEIPGNDLSLINPQGILSDVAPTVLKIMKLRKPKEMTGRSLIK